MDIIGIIIIVGFIIYKINGFSNPIVKCPRCGAKYELQYTKCSNCLKMGINAAGRCKHCGRYTPNLKCTCGATINIERQKIN